MTRYFSRNRRPSLPPAGFDPYVALALALSAGAQVRDRAVRR